MEEKNKESTLARGKCELGISASGRPNSKSISLILVVAMVVPLLAGCDAFVRKFTRKKKPAEQKQEEMVIAPQEYVRPEISKVDQYRQYYLYWRSWQDELIESFNDRSNRKKQLSCIEEASKNLAGIKTLVGQKKQAKLDGYINDLAALGKDVGADYYGNNISFYRQTAEKIKRNVMKDFSYSQLKNDLKQ
ncbi:MAG: hypothetical protein MUF05_06945 [Candidatus Omnitrophica bacterium]|jgi:hypothetical protein|nr:hypothetical protein [Candidatus Omnitrophota bacterium]